MVFSVNRVVIAAWPISVSLGLPRLLENKVTYMTQPPKLLITSTEGRPLES